MQVENGTLLMDLSKGVQEETTNNENIRMLLTDYFNNPLMTKVKNDGDSSYYFVKVNTQLLGEKRYIIAITSIDNNPIGKRMYLKSIMWKSLQTRSLKTNYNVESITYYSDLLDNYYLRVIDRNNSHTTYSSDDIDNINVHLLHIQNNNLYEYPSQATLSGAIEKFQTLINII